MATQKQKTKTKTKAKNRMATQKQTNKQTKRRMDHPSRVGQAIFSFLVTQKTQKILKKSDVFCSKILEKNKLAYLSNLFCKFFYKSLQDFGKK